MGLKAAFAVRVCSMGPLKSSQAPLMAGQMEIHARQPMHWDISLDIRISV
jgi:hypothetical protein